MNSHQMLFGFFSNVFLFSALALSFKGEYKPILAHSFIISLICLIAMIAWQLFKEWDDRRTEFQTMETLGKNEDTTD